MLLEEKLTLLVPDKSKAKTCRPVKNSGDSNASFTVLRIINLEALWPNHRLVESLATKRLTN